MDYKIIIINDGSRPECDDIFETLKNRFQCIICYHKKNKGKGSSLKTGFQFVLDNFPHNHGCITLDADGQHTPEDVIKISNAMEKHPNQFILGTRDFSNNSIPFKSKWGNRITSFVFLLFTGKQCKDTQTGLRGIPSNLLASMMLVPGSKYEYEMNMLMSITRNEIPIGNIPIATVYIEDNKSSHFHPIKDSVTIYFNIIKYSIPSQVRKTEIRKGSYK
jgi:glycosyltransferase involved in cell wall biosynthesis